MLKLLYKPLGVGIGIAAGGLAACTTLARVWTLARVGRAAPGRASWTAAQTVSNGVSRAARLPGSPLSAHCHG